MQLLICGAHFSPTGNDESYALTLQNMICKKPNTWSEPSFVGGKKKKEEG